MLISYLFCPLVIHFLLCRLQIQPLILLEKVWLCLLKSTLEKDKIFWRLDLKMHRRFVSVYHSVSDICDGNYNVVEMKIMY